MIGEGVVVAGACFDLLRFFLLPTDGSPGWGLRPAIDRHPHQRDTNTGLSQMLQVLREELITLWGR
jgi:hypothetical protein